MKIHKAYYVDHNVLKRFTAHAAIRIMALAVGSSKVSNIHPTDIRIKKYAQLIVVTYAIFYGYHKNRSNNTSETARVLAMQFKVGEVDFTYLYPRRFSVAMSKSNNNERQRRYSTPSNLSEK